MHSSLVSCDPSEWIALQSPMELVAPDLKGNAVIGDDKDHSKIWVADQGDLCSGPVVGQERRSEAS